jgi:hypothetical protein
MNTRRAWVATLFVGIAMVVALLPATVTAGKPIGVPILIGDEEVDTVDPAVAHNTIWEEYLVVWYNDRPGFDDIYGQLVSRHGALIGGRRAIAATGAERRYPDVAYNPNWNEYLVVWEHYDPGTDTFSIRGTRVASDGTATGGEIIISESGPRLGFKPKVAHSFTSGYYLVVWKNHTQSNIADDIYGQLVSNTGALSGGNFTIAQGTWQTSYELPDLAYNRRSNEFLVAWQQRDSGTGRYGVYARIVRPDGTMAPNAIEIGLSSSDNLNPAVGAIPTATAAGQYLVVWENQYQPTDHDILARIVWGNGSAAIGAYYVSSSSDHQVHPAVAGNERSRTYLISWTEDLGWSNIHALELTSTGVALGGEQVLAGEDADRSAVSDGPMGGFLVAYDDQPSTPDRETWGCLWGNRIYLPIALHSH